MYAMESGRYHIRRYVIEADDYLFMGSVGSNRDDNSNGDWAGLGITQADRSRLWIRNQLMPLIHTLRYTPVQ